tara:strand:+ start:58 stop:582 length:525 start_codon:yes stop_codon:yes gene_type:complete
MNYDAPIYALSPIILKNNSGDSVQIGRYISIIPKIKEFELEMLDIYGEFNNAITRQILPIIYYMNNELNSNELNSKESDINEETDDIVLIGFVKDYKYTTQCLFQSFTDIDLSNFDIDIKDCTIGNSILKEETNYIHKFNINLNCENNTLLFTQKTAEKNIDSEEFNSILKKFL